VIISNRAGQPAFDPRPSAAQPAASIGAGLPTIGEAFVAKAAPTVVSNDLFMIADPGAASGFDPFLPPETFVPVFLPSVNLFAAGGFAQVLQATFAIPTPCLVSLSPWSGGPGGVGGQQFNFRFRRAAKLPAVAQNRAGARSMGGVYVVEFGIGSNRQWLMTDLAPGTLQIPSCTFVRVFAFMFDDAVGAAPAAQPSSVVAGAQVYPGRIIQNPRATYTISRRDDTGVGLGLGTTIAVPPFARDLSMSFFLQPAALGTAVVGRFSTILSDYTAVPLAAWTMQSPVINTPFAATVQTLPQRAEREQVPGSAAFVNTLADYPAFPVTDIAAGTVTFGIVI